MTTKLKKKTYKVYKKETRIFFIQQKQITNNQLTGKLRWFPESRQSFQPSHRPEHNNWMEKQNPSDTKNTALCTFLLPKTIGIPVPTQPQHNYKLFLQTGFSLKATNSHRRHEEKHFPKKKRKPLSYKQTRKHFFFKSN